MLTEGQRKTQIHKIRTGKEKMIIKKERERIIKHYME